MEINNSDQKEIRIDPSYFKFKKSEKKVLTVGSKSGKTLPPIEMYPGSNPEYDKLDEISKSKIREYLKARTKQRW